MALHPHSLTAPKQPSESRIQQGQQSAKQGAVKMCLQQHLGPGSSYPSLTSTRMRDDEVAQAGKSGCPVVELLNFCRIVLNSEQVIGSMRLGAAGADILLVRVQSTAVSTVRAPSLNSSAMSERSLTCDAGEGSNENRSSLATRTTNKTRFTEFNT